MAVTYEKSTGDIVINGWQEGIAGSPHEGIANMQNVNISTSPGEVMANFSRVLQTNPPVINAQFSQISSGFVQLLGGLRLFAGSWITITNAGGTGLSGDYYILTSTSNNTVLSLSTTYKGSAVGGITAGTATFNSKANLDLGQVVQMFPEDYFDASFNTQYRIWALTTNGLVWLYDSGDSNTITNGLYWALVDTGALAGTFNNATGIGVIGGYVLVKSGNSINARQSIIIPAENGWRLITQGLNALPGSNFKGPLFVGHQSTLYIPDNNFIDYIFPSSTSSADNANVQSSGTYTFSGSTLSLGTVTQGNIPIGGSTISFTTGGTAPTGSGFGVNTILYVKVGSVTLNTNPVTFQIATTPTGSAISLSGGSGTQYYNTFNPSLNATMGQITSTGITQGFGIVFAACTFPVNQQVQCLGELGSDLEIGTNSATLYFWDQVSPQPNSFVILEEANVTSITQAGNTSYAPFGTKGNVFATSGSAESKIMKFADYIGGIAGTPASYIEPVFTFLASAYTRARVLIAFQDQTATKTGVAGGIYSFVPVQGIAESQDAGTALRLENFNSYGTGNGATTALCVSPNQSGLGLQYWSAWVSNVESSPTYGIDFTGTDPTLPATIETDLIPIGTMLKPKTLNNIEWKVASPLINGESITIKYRNDATSAWQSLGSPNLDPSGLSGYYTVNFEKSQWLQLQITLNPVNGVNKSFVRLTEIRIR